MVIVQYTNVSDMLGVGEEWLLDAFGDVIAVFYNGNLRCSISKLPNSTINEITKVVA